MTVVDFTEEELHILLKCDIANTEDLTPDNRSDYMKAMTKIASAETKLRISKYTNEDIIPDLLPPVA